MTPEDNADNAHDAVRGTQPKAGLVPHQQHAPATAEHGQERRSPLDQQDTASGQDTMPARDESGETTVPRSYRQAVTDLSAAQKSNKGAPLYSRIVNRPWGRRFAALAYVLGLTPNQVTAISAVFTFSSLILLVAAPMNWWIGIAAAVGLATGYAFDAADGQLARLQGGGSLSGEWLDHMVDAFKDASLHLVVLIALYLKTDFDHALLLVPIGFCAVGTVSFFAQLLNEQLKRNKDAQKLGPQSSSLLRSFLGLPTDYGVLCWSFILWGSAPLWFGFYSLLFIGTTGYLVLALFKWYADMKRIDSLGVNPS